MTFQIEACRGVFREIKARKALFGFTHSIRGDVDTLIGLGFILSEVQRCYPKDLRIETSNGMNVITVNIYTDRAEAADWFRTGPMTGFALK